MKIKHISPPRTFKVGAKKKINITHTADVSLDENEQVTFVGDDNSEIDIVKKSWGYYLTPSINKRLLSFGIFTYLVQNSRGNIFVMAVEKKKLKEFMEYITFTEQKIIINLSEIYCAQ